jgi:hypothetical protein
MVVPIDDELDKKNCFLSTPTKVECYICIYMAKKNVTQIEVG